MTTTITTSRTSAAEADRIFRNRLRAARTGPERDAVCADIRRHYRGMLALGKFKNYCCNCGGFLFLDSEADADRTDLRCEGCGG